MPTIPKGKRPHWIPERKAHDRRKGRGLFNYNAQAWRKDRAAHLALNPLCAHCLEKGIETVATVSDHIIPISQGGNVWAWSNRQPLCDACHNVKSGKEAHL